MRNVGERGEVRERVVRELNNVLIGTMLFLNKKKYDTNVVPTLSVY